MISANRLRADYGRVQLAAFQKQVEAMSAVLNPLTFRPWLVLFSMERSELRAPAELVVRRVALAVMLSIALTTSLLVLFVHLTVIKPARLTSANLRIAATGDLLVRSATRGGDELQQMGSRYNRLMISLSMLVSRVMNGSVDQTCGLIEDHTVNVSETSVAVEQMVGNVHSIQGAVERSSSKPSPRYTAQTRRFSRLSTS